MAKSSGSLDNQTFIKLRRLYIIALTTIALSVIISQIIIRNYLNDQQGDATIINVAGRQRMLSQKLTKQTLLLLQAENLSSKTAIKNRLKETQKLWKTSHNGLLKGNDSLKLLGENSKRIIVMYREINPYYEAILNASNSIIKKVESNPENDQLALKKEVASIKENEGEFLVLMDQIVNQYNIEASKKVNRLRKLELFLMAFTLTILLAEFIFIFWPSAKFVKRKIKKLLKSEKKALKNAREANQLRENNEKSVRELRTLYQVMDRTLLFARMRSNGDVVHMGDKFRQLFKVSSLTKGLKFSEVISTREKEQGVINDLLSSHSKLGWQGEVKGTEKNNEGIWLEMYIIPFYGVNESSELLIIASDITKSKKAQLKVEALTNERYQETMNQQKLISSKIIENQEKEQNRIAKDIHDGIGQMLTGLKFNLESINPSQVEKASAKIEYLKELTTNIIQGVRTATFNLA